MTYRELYPNSLSLGEGLISALSEDSRVPWNSMDLEARKSLEQAYNIHSGYKQPITAFQLADSTARVEILIALFNDKWKRLWDDFSIEYNPLDAYKVDETVVRDRDVTGDSSTTYGRTTAVTSTDGGTGTTTTTASTSSDDFTYGFNSQLGQAVPSQSSTVGDTETVKEDRDFNSSENTSNSGTDTYNRTRNEDETVTTTRSGNIGYTTPQKLLKEDIELWAKPYFNLVFADIDSFIMLQTYSF